MSFADFPELDLPEPTLSLELRAGQVFVQDILRKHWLVLTPEEWVRQHVVFWLLAQTGFPAGLLSVERLVTNRKRADVVGYNRSGAPLLLVECKAPGVRLNVSAARQALRYNQTLNARFVWVTNGKVHVVFAKDAESIEFKQISMLPTFAEML